MWFRGIDFDNGVYRRCLNFIIVFVFYKWFIKVIYFYIKEFMEFIFMYRIYKNWKVVGYRRKMKLDIREGNLCRVDYFVRKFKVLCILIC